jgi:hypothetical protein
MMANSGAMQKVDEIKQKNETNAPSSEIISIDGYVGRPIILKRRIMLGTEVTLSYRSKNPLISSGSNVCGTIPLVGENRPEYNSNISNHLKYNDMINKAAKDDENMHS